MNHSQMEIHNMVSSLGATMEDVQEVGRLDSTQWAVVFGSGANVLLDWADAPPRVLLSSLLGRPHPVRCQHVYETLLAFNSLWADGNGTWLALNGTEGEVMLMYELPSTDVTLDALQEAVSGMSMLAAAWGEFVMADPDSSRAPPMMFGVAA